MYKKWALLTFLLPLFLTGCWDKKDPEDRAFIITLGADATKEGCRFTFAPANIETEEPYLAESKTLAGAVAQVDTRSSRKTDLGQLKTVILGKELLQDSKKLDSLLGELERSQAVSEKVMLLAADSAAECVERVMKEDSRTGLFLWDFYKNTAGEVAVTRGMDLDTFLTERTEQGSVLPRIRVAEDRLQLGGGMALSANGVSLWDEAEERGYLFLLGAAEGAVPEAEDRGESLPLCITKTKAGYAFRQAGDAILCDITLLVKGSLQGGQGISAQRRQELEKKYNEIIKKEVEHTIKIAKTEKTDWFGILPRLRRAMPNASESDAQLWERLAVRVSPRVEITDMGRKR